MRSFLLTRTEMDMASGNQLLQPANRCQLSIRFPSLPTYFSKRKSFSSSDGVHLGNMSAELIVLSCLNLLINLHQLLYLGKLREVMKQLCSLLVNKSCWSSTTWTVRASSLLLILSLVANVQWQLFLYRKRMTTWPMGCNGQFSFVWGSLPSCRDIYRSGTILYAIIWNRCFLGHITDRVITFKVLWTNVYSYNHLVNIL